MIGDLVERIEVHRRWQASLGAEGERLSLTGENLRGVDLSVPEQLGAELYNANLDGATPARTVLGNAYLSGASLRGADLTDLLAYFLAAGAVVSFSTGPPPIPWVYG